MNPKSNRKGERKYNPINILDMEILGTKGNYRLVNDGCATVPYLITIEKKKVYPSKSIVWERVPNTPIYTDYKKAIIALDNLK